MNPNSTVRYRDIGTCTPVLGNNPRVTRVIQADNMTSKRARDHQHNKATLLLAITRQSNPEHARVVESMDEAYHEERERVLGQSKRKLTELAVFDILCKQTFAELVSHVLCEFHYYEALPELCECMRIFASALGNLDATVSPSSGDFATMRDGALVRVRAVVASGKTRAAVVDSDVRSKFQSRRFALKYNTLPKLVALAQGDVKSTIFDGGRTFDRDRLYNDLVREDLFVGALIVYERLRKARMLLVVGSDWVGFLSDKLGVCISTRIGADEQNIGALHAALERSFISAVHRRLNHFQRACIIRSRIVDAESSIREQKEENARLREQVRMMQAVSSQT